MKSSQKNWSRVFILCSLLGLTGCNELVNWSKDHLQQPDEQKRNFSAVSAQYSRHKKVYEQFTSLADFTALFLSDTVRLAYLDFYVYRNFKSDEDKQSARIRFLAENDYYISFYLSAWQRPTEYMNERTLFTGERHTLGEILGGPDAEWQVNMRVDGIEYEPEIVEQVEIPLEYRVFFGSWISQFKKTYMLKFLAHDKNNKVILDRNLHDVELVFRRLHQEVRLSWIDTHYKSVE